MRLLVHYANCTEIRVGRTRILFSYDQPVAAVVNDQAYRTQKKWSPTTEKHVKWWLGEAHHANPDLITKPQDWFNNLGGQIGEECSNDNT